MSENVLEPKHELIKKDWNYVLREMLMQCLRTENVIEGIDTSLGLLREFLNSGNVIIYKQTDEGRYEARIMDTPIDSQALFPITCMTNKNAIFAEREGIYEEHLNEHISTKYRDLMNIYVNMEGRNFVTVIINPDKTISLEPEFWRELRDTLAVILKRASSYEKHQKEITMDLKLGVDNRNSYEMTLQSLRDDIKGLSIAIFDLYRLKYINDRYSHSLGDEYLKQAARVLKKWWPTYTPQNENDHKIEKVFRYGGDEFVVLDNIENYYLNLQKAEHAQREFSYYRLPGAEEVPIGFNYGVAGHIPGNKIQDTFDEADEIMKRDKEAMYLRYHHERRGQRL